MQPLNNHSWTWLFVWGIALVLLGTLAIAYAASTTLVSVIIFGVILTASGIVIAFDAFKTNWGKWGEFFMKLGMGVLYLIAGIILIKGPVMGSLTLTLILAIFYIVLGLFRTVFWLTHSNLNRGWRLASSIITLLLGILILVEWPASGLLIIGLFIGIDLIFTGWLSIMAAFGLKKANIK